MKTLMASLTGSVGIMVLGIIFVLLFAVIHHVLQKQSPFQGKTAIVVAFCAALLAVLGLGMDFGPAHAPAAPISQQEPTIRFLVLPYEAMAIAMLLTILVWLFLKLFGRKPKPWQPETHHPRVDHTDKQQPSSHRADKPSSTTSNKTQQDDQHNRVERKK